MNPGRAAILGLLQATALALYCWGVSLIFLNPNLSRLFARADPTIGIIFFLILFVFSAVVSAALVLGYPGYLVLKGQWKGALGLVGATVGWLGLFLLLLALAIFGSR